MAEQGVFKKPSEMSPSLYRVVPHIFATPREHLEKNRLRVIPGRNVAISERRTAQLRQGGNTTREILYNLLCDKRDQQRAY